MARHSHPTFGALETVALGDLIRRHRETSGLSQESLGRSVGLPQARIAEIELAKRRLDVIEFVQLARALNSDPTELFKEMMNSFDQLEKGES